MEIDAFCPHCRASVSEVLKVGEEQLSCRACQKNLLEHLTEETRQGVKLSQCPLCGAAHTYRQKDFNRKLGVGLIVLGVGLAYFTYGVSLLAVTLIDWIIAKKVAEVGCCYQCHAQFRKSPMIETMEPFQLTLFDYYKNLSR